jgi:ABC-type multidrug transport system fused ATPase/permease subunit
LLLLLLVFKTGRTSDEPGRARLPAFTLSQEVSDRGGPMPGVLVKLDRVAKTYGPVHAVNDVSLDVHEGEFLTLLGPSGSGKTTMLMLIAGFEHPSSGEILVRGASVVAQPPHHRDIGMVFQSYALFPHMTVFGNVAFPLRARKTPGREIESRVRQVSFAIPSRRWPRRSTRIGRRSLRPEGRSATSSWASSALPTWRKPTRPHGTSCPTS